MNRLLRGIFRPFAPLFIGLLTFSGLQLGWAQPVLVANERITNIRLSAVNQTSLEILYDLAASNPGDSIFFEVTGRKSGVFPYNPGFVEGDFGLHVQAGPNRRIVWNVLANGYQLNEEIRVRVLIKPVPLPAMLTDSLGFPLLADSTRHKPWINELTAAPTRQPYRPGGPAMALLSFLVPGLGNVFVQNPKPKIGFRPLITVGVATAIAYGLNQRRQAEGQYQLYTQQKNPTEGEPYYQQANRQHHLYYLATRAAAALWLSDVAATFIRGLRNRAGRRDVNPANFKISYQANTPVAAFTFHF